MEQDPAEFVSDDRLVSVKAWRAGLASNSEDIGVVVSLTVGEDIQLEAGGELVFSMDLGSAGRLAVSLGRTVIEAEAAESAGRN